MVRRGLLVVAALALLACGESEKGTTILPGTDTGTGTDTGAGTDIAADTVVSPDTTTPDPDTGKTSDCTEQPNGIPCDDGHLIIGCHLISKHPPPPL